MTYAGAGACEEMRIDLFSYLSLGGFVIIDLIAATTNALNGTLLAHGPITTGANTGRP